MSAREEIDNANAIFMATFAKGDATGVAACYDENGWFMVPGAATLKGREAIAAGLQGLMDSGISGLELVTLELEDFDDTAIETGEYILCAGEDIADRGRFMVHWKCVYGKWYIHRDIINSTMPAAE